MEKSLAVPQKVKQSYHMTQQFQTKIIDPRELKLHVNTITYESDSNIIYNIPKVETQMSIG